MSVHEETAAELERLKAAKAAIAAAIEGKDVTVPDGTKLDALAALIEAIETGGLHTGISALACGTYTPTSDVSSFSFTHNLGVKPNFWVVMLKNSANSLTANTTVAGLGIRKSLSGASSYLGAHAAIWYGATNDNYYGQAGYDLSSSSTLWTSTTLTVHTFANYKFASGKTYTVICGVLDGIS